MKKRLTLAIGFVSIALSVAVLAGNVYDRTTKAIVSTATWTNSLNYAALELKRIWVSGDTCLTGVVTVTRITSDSAYTQAVGSVTCTAGAGSTASFTAAYLKPGDMLYFSESLGSNATAIIEYEVQKH